jgi:nicotinate-nucleotide pyrophosphorylase (carboxylating)
MDTLGTYAPPKTALTDFELAGFDVSNFIRATLAEDLGEGLPGGGRDVTCESVIPVVARFAGVMDSRDAIIVAGLTLAAAFFRHLDPGVEIDMLARDGDRVTPGTALMRISGGESPSDRSSCSAKAWRAETRYNPDL